jgi:hypothetical protein
MNEERDEFKVEIVDLNDFAFMPPGSMGWNDQELDEIVNNVEQYVVVNDEQNVEEMLSSLEHSLLVELPPTSVEKVKVERKIIEKVKEPVVETVTINHTNANSKPEKRLTTTRNKKNRDLQKKLVEASQSSITMKQLGSILFEDTMRTIQAKRQQRSPNRKKH